MRRLKANWFAAPTVATVTRCLSSSTTVNCTHGQEEFRVQGMHCACSSINLKPDNVIRFPVSHRTVTATERHQDALLPAARAHSAYSGSPAPATAASTSSSSSGS